MCSTSMWNIIITRGIIKAKATCGSFLQSAKTRSGKVRFSVVNGLAGCSNTTNERPREFFDHTGWEDTRSPEEIIAEIYAARTVSHRGTTLLPEEPA
jgi:hypothetical protein